MGDAGHRALRRPTCGRPQPGPGDAASRIGPALPLRGHLRPGVFQGERPVEDGPPRRGIGVGAEVAEPLELDRLADGRRGERRLDERPVCRRARLRSTACTVVGGSCPASVPRARPLGTVAAP